uniref:Degenerin unc-8 n=1 Tax=Macrostomum lignano TaxID=282301 RepID=A0A1I8HKR9_9PLAT
MEIETPDVAKTSTDNYCRSVSIVMDIANENYSHFERQKAFESEIPACLPERALRFIDRVEISQHTLFEMAFEPCNLALCYSKFRSVPGAIRDSVGRHLLARQFGSDLSIALASCSFAGQKCTNEHFVNFEHPQLGMCHQFLKKKFTANMTSTQLANSELSIMYFTDSTDSKGRLPFGMEKLNQVVHDSVMSSSDDSNTALNAIIVPEKKFPWASRSIAIAAAQRMDVQLRFEKYSRLSTKSSPCQKIEKLDSYRLPSWDVASSNSGGNDLKGSERQFVSDREDCINTYIVEKFIDYCKCLPSFQPIPVALVTKYKNCFDIKDISNFSRVVETCYNEQVSQIQRYQFEGSQLCQPPCRTDDYSTRFVTYSWPNLKNAQSVKLIKQLASNFGYRTSISGMRGLANIYQVLLKVQSYSESSSDNKTASDRLNFDIELEALQNRLAWLTVKAWSAKIQEISEEEAYPTKNLVADFGGILGLWCGVSILTLCELLELLLYIFRALFALKSDGTVQSEMNSYVGSTETTAVEKVDEL